MWEQWWRPGLPGLDLGMTECARQHTARLGTWRERLPSSPKGALFPDWPSLPPLHVFRWLQKHRNNYTELLSWIATTALVRIIFCYWGCWFDCRYFFQPQGKIESPWLIKEDSVLWYSLSFVNFMYTHSSTEHLLIFPTVLKKLLFLHSFIYVKSPALLLYFSGFPSSHQTNLYLFLELKSP